MQLELYFKKEYVCQIPTRRLKHFKHILRKDKLNEFVHLLFSFFLLILAQSNYDHYARECDFGILKKKQKQNNKKSKNKKKKKN